MKLSNCKILVLPYTHTLSHLSRPLEISKRLSSQGYKISFGGDSSKIHFIKDEGFEVHSAYEPDPNILFNNIRNRKLNFVDNDTLDLMIESDLRLFEKLKPDIVITDGRFSAMISTQIAGLKHAAIVNASSTAYRAIPYFPLFNGLTDDKHPINSFFSNLLNPLNLKFEIFFFDNMMRIFKRLSKKYQLKREVTATNCLCGVNLTLMADIPEFFPTKNLPSNYHYIGPVTWKAPKSKILPDWWPIDKGEKKLSYITMGTTGESGLFEKIYDTFKVAENMISVITTGEQTDKIKSIPGKIYVTDFMDGDTIMEKADLVVCHGGNGTIYQALTFGKPIIGIPTIPDQDFNMRMVENLHVGKKISMNDMLANPVHLENEIRIITSGNSDMEIALSKINKQLGQINGAFTGSQIISNFIEKQL
ncbi:glycosyltransferase [Desulforapulum autotrophicum]|nr:glycosyltransferase [Desulforapulum autotrophicum]